MELVYRCNPNLPSLAWLARVNGDKVEVQHGEKVETHERFFVEGAWGGYFSEGEFDTAEWFCGTGAVLRGDAVVFASPTAMHAGIFMVQNENGVVLSNSLPFLMASEDYRYDADWIGYERFFNYNILQGIYRYEPAVHALKRAADGTWTIDESIQLILFRNITILHDGTVHIAVKPETKGFDSYEEYYERLVAAMRATADNGRDSHRKVRYRVTSYISSGYDSAACAAVAKLAGAEKVLTFSAKGKYEKDSGVGAAKYLGYKTAVERDAYAYMERTDFPEVQSISSGDIGNIISFTSFENDVKEHLVFSGENGDAVWCRDKTFRITNDDIHLIWKNAEFGLSEAHLHQGYIPITMVSFGIRHWTDLYRISNSEEMWPWSLGNDYDRPIPRRLLEEKGLPRQSFGMEKHGAGFFYAYDWKKRILRRMSPVSAREFDEFVKKHKHREPLRTYAGFVWANRASFFNALMAKIHIGCRLAVPDSDVERINGIPSPFAARYLIPWAGDHMIGEYKRAIEKQ